MLIKIRAKQVPTCEHKGQTIIRYERLMYVDGILKWEDVQYSSPPPGRRKAWEQGLRDAGCA